ncbi:S1C family serine protease [Blautia massiliensis (ex Durand et al. 2017)]|uniref:S1C family serine protease n=1 Tax=Blautia massiliensis (ex Durand et al. 2017) TaxID=1737424 RepID=UPI0022E8C0A5|nr:trypsin-like peptidase domain-containing protein [Blautia massiliensis (ex Durand et al. 2017)]
MSEENKWGTGLPDDDKNVSAEQKPLTHPYSEGRRMQESGQNSDAGAGQSEGVSQEKTKYGHYEVHQPQAGNYAGGNIPPKKPRKKRDFSGNNSFGKKAATAVALAVIFGLVAGAVFQGVNIAADKYRGNDSSTTIGKTETVTGTEDSTGSSSADSTVKDIVAESGTVAGVAQATMSSIVAITSVSVQEIPSFFGYGTRQYQSAGSGSGIIVGENDSELLIATNNHVVSGATTLTVCFAGSDVVGAEEETQAMASSGSTGFGSDGDVDVDNAVSAKIKGTDEENDLAVVAVEKSDIPNETMEEIKIAQLGSSDDLVVGEQVVAIGNALGYGQSVTSGWVSALNRSIGTEDGEASGLIQTDAAINPGNSGGALLNMNGEVIGINAAKYADSQVEGMGYAIPISKAEPILEELMNRETRDKVEDSSKVGYMGVKAADLTTEAIQMYNMPAGAFITEVTEGGAADNAGIKKGDIIVKLDGQKVSGKDDLVDKLQYYEAGENIEVVISRANSGEYKEQTIEVILGSKPSSDK